MVIVCWQRVVTRLDDMQTRVIGGRLAARWMDVPPLAYWHGCRKALERSMGWGRLLLVVLLIGGLVALAFHYGTQLGSRMVEVEDWIADLGIWGLLMFFGLFIVLTSLFFPDSVLSALAGALFGTLVGAVVVIVGAIVAQIIAFGISRNFLQHRVRRAIMHRPKLTAFQRAADREGFRLQLLLRLTPLNPVAVSHVLGTTGTPFGVFLLACLGLIPSLFVQVYCGYTARHMIEAAGQVGGHSTMQTMLVVAGLIACLLVFVIVTRIAQKALAEAER